MTDLVNANEKTAGSRDLLVKYLSYIIDLEKDCYAQKQALSEIDAQVQDYNSELVENQRKIDETTVTYREDDVKTEKAEAGLFASFYLCYFGALPGVAVNYITGNFWLAFLIGAIGVLIVYEILKIWEIKKTEERAQQDKEKYRKKIAANKLLNENRALRNEELSVYIPRLELERDKLQETNQNTKNTLDQLYAVGFIPEKYRYFVAVCSFYDYITSGRTYSICKNEATFDEGAVNIYEKDQQFGLIVDKLDQIIYNLKSLRAEQQEIRRAIEEGNRITHNLLTSINTNIEKVNDNLETVQYQNDQQRKCQQYMASIAYSDYMSS